MKHPVLIRPEAEADLQSTFEWYQQQEEGLGIEFLRCVEASIFLISRSPKIFFPIYKGVRRVLTRRFPYGIFYIIAEGKVIVIAVLHVRRHSLRWQQRR